MDTQNVETVVALHVPDASLTPPITPPVYSAKPFVSSAVDSGMKQSGCAGNPEGPDNHLQVFQKSLLEYDFIDQDAFVAARIQRIQHGIYTNPDKLEFYGSSDFGKMVTFVAVTFTFHPMHSVQHRFQRAIIEITAQDNEQHPLKFAKFAPHLAYGRVSTEALHWTFSLSSTVGITQPFNASVTPSTAFDKQKIIDSMLKIQGSTRTHRGIESGKLIWSLEENQQQSTGLPREFTFVFLLERPDPRSSLSLAISIKPTFSKDVGLDIFNHDSVHGGWVNLGNSGMGQRFSTTPFNFADMCGQFEDLIELPGNAIRVAEEPAPTVASQT